MMSDLFSNEKVNVGRQLELDIAKGLSIIFMILMHGLMVVTVFENTISPSYQFVIGNILGKPMAAPIFMFCMGVGVVYSRHSQAEAMIKRGIRLYLLGILVNVFEFFLPCYLSGVLLNKWDLFPTAGGLLLFCVDILAFAGLAFILMGILKKFELSNKLLLGFGIILSLLGSVLRFTDCGNDLLNLFFGNFIGTEGGFTAFPLFNWFIFPIAGYVWGQYFIRCNDKRKFFKYWPIYILVALAYFICSARINGGFLVDSHHYYFMTTLDVIFCLIYAHGNIGLCYYLKDILPGTVNKIFSILSTNINMIYIVQWFYIPVVMILIVYIFKDIVFTDLILFLFTVSMIILSTLTAMLYKNKTTSRRT